MALTDDEKAQVKRLVRQLFDRWRTVTGQPGASYADMANAMRIREGMMYDWTSELGSTPSSINLLRLMAEAQVLTNDLELPEPPSAADLLASERVVEEAARLGIVRRRRGMP